MTLISTIVIVLVLALLVYYAYYYARASPYIINPDLAKKLLKMNKIDVVLDVRTDLERNTLGFYPGSIHIQSSDLEKQMPLQFPNKNISILAYCNTGHRAKMATNKLHKLGYKNAVYIATTYTLLL